MDVFLDWAEAWLSRWPETAAWLAVASSLLTLVVAIVAAFYAKRQVDHARQERRDRNRPFVTVSLQATHSIVANIVIKNEGATLASNVRFAFEPEWESSDPKRTSIRDSKLFREGIPTLVPGQSFRIFADMFPARYKSDLPTTYQVKVTCQGPDGVDYDETYVLDFDVFHGYSTATLFDTHDVADALRTISRRMEGWAEHSFGPLKVIVRDGDKRDAAELAEMTETRPRHGAAGPAEAAVSARAGGVQHAVVQSADMATTFHAQHPVTRGAPVEREDDVDNG